MSGSLNQIREKPFYKLLLGRTTLPLVTILGIGTLYAVLMSMIDHKSLPFHIIIVKIDKNLSFIGAIAMGFWFDNHHKCFFFCD